MIISEYDPATRNAPPADQSPRPGDVLNMAKFNALPGPVTARLSGGSEWWIETLDVQTGAMRVDVCGMIDRHSFGDVMMLIDQDGVEHDPDEFWLE